MTSLNKIKYEKIVKRRKIVIVPKLEPKIGPNGSSYVGSMSGQGGWYEYEFWQITACAVVKILNSLFLLE